MRVHWVFLFAITTLVVALDQLTKALVVANLALNEEWAPFPALAHLFAFTHITNTGAAFGILPDAGAAFLLIRMAVVVLILYYYRKLPPAIDGGASGPRTWLMRLALGLLLGGALGNLIDQLRLGHVIDFIHLKFWPVFNVADSGVVIGVVLLAGVLLLEERKARASRTAQGEEEESL